MNVLRLCGLLMLLGVGSFTHAQDAPRHATRSERYLEAPGLAENGLSIGALFAENAQLRKQVELLNKKVQLLELRIRTLEGSQ